MQRSDTSARYHRPRGRPRTVRYFGQQEQGTDIRFPFQGLPVRTGEQLSRWNVSPLTRFLGFGPQAGTGRARRMDENLAGGTGPLAEAIRAIRGFTPAVGPMALEAGARASDAGEAMFEQLRGQISSALAQLPGFQAQAGRAAALAGRNLEGTFSPLANEDLYQTASRRLVGAIRPGLAARGMESAGAAGQAETDALRALTQDLTGQQRGARLAALEASRGATGDAAALAGAGVPLAGAGVGAVPALMQALQSGYGMPLEALGSLLALLSTGTAPSLGLLGATGPIAASESKGWNFL